MSQPETAGDGGLVDLVDVPLDELRDMDDSVLAQSLRLLKERLRDGRLPLDSFNSVI